MSTKKERDEIRRQLAPEVLAEIDREVTREVVEEVRARHKTWPKLTRDEAPHLFPPDGVLA